jgi:carbon storage regulator
MLVLSRKQDQRVKLGDGIVVTVLRVGRDRVRLGIDAPPEVHVLRGELELQAAAPLGTSPGR